MPIGAGAGAAIIVEVVVAAHAEVAGVIASAVDASDVADVAVVGDQAEKNVAFRQNAP